LTSFFAFAHPSIQPKLKTIKKKQRNLKFAKKKRTRRKIFIFESFRPNGYQNQNLHEISVSNQCFDLFCDVLFNDFMINLHFGISVKTSSSMKPLLVLVLLSSLDVFFAKAKKHEIRKKKNTWKIIHF